MKIVIVNPLVGRPAEHTLRAVENMFNLSITWESERPLIITIKGGNETHIERLNKVGLFAEEVK